jgi:hypothetical protein
MEPVTSRIVAQCLNQLCRRVPQQVQEGRLNIKNKQNVQIEYSMKLIMFRYIKFGMQVADGYSVPTHRVLNIVLTLADTRYFERVMAVTLCYVRNCEQQHNMRHSGF